jgi:hypothetical protein
MRSIQGTEKKGFRVYGAYDSPQLHAGSSNSLAAIRSQLIAGFLQAAGLMNHHSSSCCAFSRNESEVPKHLNMFSIALPILLWQKCNWHSRWLR